MKINIIKTLLIAVPVLMISCSDMGNNTDMVKKLDEISDAQNVLLKNSGNCNYNFYTLSYCLTIHLVIFLNSLLIFLF